MPASKFSLPCVICIALAFAFATLLATDANAQAAIVFDFTGADGSSPQGGVIFDQAGNIYGTTLEGGTTGDGTVFELLPQAGGGWSEQILHSFTAATSDGENPRGSSLTLDASGSLYGTTTFGGSKGTGVVYVLVHSGSSWHEKIVHTFGRFGGDGFYPKGTLVLDASGNLYGVTSNGGAYGYGTVYQISVATNGTWTEKILYSFNNNGHDGNSPLGTLIFDGAGNLYGTTQLGGLYSGGTVFELVPQPAGAWKERILYHFHERPGATQPYTGVVMDASGNLYGTTHSGGKYDYGTVYRLSLRAAGGWQETILYSFTGNDVGISGPATELTFDTAGNLYGTTNDGGANFSGSIYKLTPNSDGTWTESTFYSFSDTSGGPAFPESGLILGPDGKFYGTTAGGGSISLGTVYSISP
jgi:uncharacterized repeat protein (TIGR03803 family)